MDNKITFRIECSGDRSVGIPGSYAEVMMYGDANDSEWLASVKEALTDAFQLIWDDRNVLVCTEAEYDAEIAAEDALLREQDEV